jgi:hypothetical protein
MFQSPKFVEAQRRVQRDEPTINGIHGADTGLTSVHAQSSENPSTANGTDLGSVRSVRHLLIVQCLIANWVPGISARDPCERTPYQTCSLWSDFVP